LRVEDTAEGRVLVVSGADMLDGTPIYDIKPYLAFADSRPDAVCGFADEVRDYSVRVDFPEHFLARIEVGKRDTLLKILSGDPRPSYKADGDRVYGMRFADYEISFRVVDGTLTVTAVTDVHD
jgi:hypothetical protein